MPEEDVGEAAVNAEGKEDASLSLTLTRGSGRRFYFNTRGAAVTLTVDCGATTDPDSVGPAFSVYAPDLAQSGSDSKAGFFRWSGPLSSGTHYVTLYHRAGQPSCRVLLQILPSTATCTGRTEHRSVATGHNHYEIGTELSSRWEKFPVSGDHWPVWADWNQIYDRPVHKGHILHNLEHGGLVLSYKCTSAASETCQQREAALISLVNQFRQRRVLVTPDPTQPTAFAIRGWRWGYQAECLDSASALKFMQSHFRQGREDIDANSGLEMDFTY